MFHKTLCQGLRYGSAPLGNSVQSGGHHTLEMVQGSCAKALESEALSSGSVGCSRLAMGRYAASKASVTGSSTSGC